jgi:DNA-binding CsgD family transcriptional regulator
LWHSFGVVNPAAAPWRRTAVRALLTLAEPAAATALAEEDLAAARRWGGAREIGVAVHTKALCLAGQERLDLLRTAVGALERLPGRVELADALVDLGIARQEVGRRSDQARSCLVRGARLARGSGAAAVRHRATAALARIDAADSDASSVGTGGDATAAGHTLLTPQEARVAALALRGRTNREIAAELELSQRTVEFHLSGVYRKFGISGRRQLVEITKLP